MLKAARRYRALFVAPGVPRLFGASITGRLPIGMAMLLFVLAVHAGTGSYAVAGFAAAANSAATALFGPVMGRLADRGHAALILLLSGLAEGAALVGLVIVLRAHLGTAIVLALAALAGIVNPPIGAVTRTVLPRLAPTEGTRQTAYALDAILIEVTFVLGPALVGVVTAIADGYTATLLAAALNVVGSLWLASAPPVRHGYAVVASPSAPKTRWHRMIGPLASRGLRTVLVVSMLEAAAFGVLEVAIPSYMNALGKPQWGGLIYAVWSVGSIVGGMWFGGQDFRVPLHRQYAILMCLNLVGFSGVLLASGPLTLGVLLFMAGLVISPTTAVEATLVSGLAPGEAMTEAFTWSGTAIYLGFALGSGLAALSLSSSLGTTNALTHATLLAVGLCATGALLTLVEQRAIGAGRPLTVPSVSALP
jgi:MFS family permease